MGISGSSVKTLAVTNMLKQRNKNIADIFVILWISPGPETSSDSHLLTIHSTVQLSMVRVPWGHGMKWVLV